MENPWKEQLDNMKMESMEKPTSSELESKPPVAVQKSNVNGHGTDLSIKQEIVSTIKTDVENQVEATTEEDVPAQLTTKPDKKEWEPFKCDVCEETLTSMALADLHFNGKQHRRKMELFFMAKCVKIEKCKLCGTNLTSLTQIYDHYNGYDHASALVASKPKRAAAERSPGRASFGSRGGGRGPSLLGPMRGRGSLLGRGGSGARGGQNNFGGSNSRGGRGGSSFGGSRGGRGGQGGSSFGGSRGGSGGRGGRGGQGGSNFGGGRSSNSFGGGNFRGNRGGLKMGGRGGRGGGFGGGGGQNNYNESGGWSASGKSQMQQSLFDQEEGGGKMLNYNRNERSTPYNNNSSGGMRGRGRGRGRGGRGGGRANNQWPKKDDINFMLWCDTCEVSVSGDATDAHDNSWEHKMKSGEEEKPPLKQVGGAGPVPSQSQPAFGGVAKQPTTATNVGGSNWGSNYGNNQFGMGQNMNPGYYQGSMAPNTAGATGGTQASSTRVGTQGNMAPNPMGYGNQNNSMGYGQSNSMGYGQNWYNNALNTNFSTMNSGYTSNPPLPPGPPPPPF